MHAPPLGPKFGQLGNCPQQRPQCGTRGVADECYRLCCQRRNVSWCLWTVVLCREAAWVVAEVEAENAGEEEAAAERDEEQGAEAGVMMKKAICFPLNEVDSVFDALINPCLHCPIPMLAVMLTSWPGRNSISQGKRQKERQAGAQAEG